MTFSVIFILAMEAIIFFVILFIKKGFKEILTPLLIFESVGFLVLLIISQIIVSRIKPIEEVSSKSIYTIESYEFQQKQVGKMSSSEFFCWVDKNGRHSTRASSIKFVDSDSYEVETEKIHIINHFWCEKDDYIRYTVYIPNNKLYKNSP